MAKQELLPCPLDGLDAQYTGKLSENDYGIECSGCRLLLRYFDTEKEAAEWWNKRDTTNG